MERDVPRREWPAASGDAAVATLAPVTIPLGEMEEVTEPFIQILHRPDNELVAVLEVLSPANKTAPNRPYYLSKRVAVIQQAVHLVELDLLISGKRLPMKRPLPPAHFYALVSRAENRPDSSVYFWTVRERLPTIPIPLKAPDGDLRIDLGEVFALAYRRGRYERAINYRRALSLPFEQADLDWISQQT